MVLKNLSKEELNPHYRPASGGNTEFVPPGNKVICIAVDEDDTVYVVPKNDDGYEELLVYSADGRILHYSVLTFIRCGTIIGMRIKNNKEIVIATSRATVYVCSRNGELINT